MNYFQQYCSYIQTQGLHFYSSISSISSFSSQQPKSNKLIYVFNEQELQRLPFSLGHIMYSKIQDISQYNQENFFYNLILNNTKTENLTLKFITQYYLNSSKQEQALIFKQPNQYFPHNLFSKYFVKFCMGISQSKAEFSNLLLKHSKKHINLKSNNLKLINNGLTKFNFSFIEQKEFLLKLLSNNKEVNSPIYGEQIKSFILHKYNHNFEDIQPFCKISTYLKNEFEDISFQFLEHSSYSTFTSLNLFNITHTLALGKPHTLLKNLLLFSKIIPTLYTDISYVIIHNQQASSYLYDLHCISHKPISKPQWENMISSFIYYIKKNNINVITHQQLSHWFLSSELKELNIPTSTKLNKPKI